MRACLCFVLLLSVDCSSCEEVPRSACCPADDGLPATRSSLCALGFVCVARQSRVVFIDLPSGRQERTRYSDGVCAIYCRDDADCPAGGYCHQYPGAGAICVRDGFAAPPPSSCDDTPLATADAAARDGASPLDGPALPDLASRDLTPPDLTAPPDAASACGFGVALADAVVRGGSNADANYGAIEQLACQGTPSVSASSRKSYLVFDARALGAFSHVELALTVIGDGSDSGMALSVWGIVDDDDWAPSRLAESAITWNSAPKNDRASTTGFAAGARLLGSFPIDPYAIRPGDVQRIDVTDYVAWAAGRNGAFSAAHDSDGLATIMLAHDQPLAYSGGPYYWSREAADPCVRPRLELR